MVWSTVKDCFALLQFPKHGGEVAWKDFWINVWTFYLWCQPKESDAEDWIYWYIYISRDIYSYIYFQRYRPTYKVTYGWRSRWRIRWLKALVITSSGSAPRVEEGIFLQSEGHYTHHQVCARSALTIEYIQSLVLTIKCARSALYWLSQCKPSGKHFPYILPKPCINHQVFKTSIVLTIEYTAETIEHTLFIHNISALYSPLSLHHLQGI